MRATFVALTMRLALMLASAAFILSALTFSPAVFANVVGAGLIGGTIGATFWLIGTAFDLAVVCLKALPMLLIPRRASALLLRANRPQ
jgi:hypothetical protein